MQSRWEPVSASQALFEAAASPAWASIASRSVVKRPWWKYGGSLAQP